MDNQPQAPQTPQATPQDVPPLEEANAALEADQAKAERKNQNLPLIIGLVVALVAIILGIIFIPKLFKGPDYQALVDSANDLSSASFPSGFYKFSDLTDGSLTEAEHKKAVEDAKETISELKTYTETIEKSIKKLEENQIEKTKSADKYHDFKQKSDNVIGKLNIGAADLDLYIEFATRFFASNLRYLTSSNNEDLAKLATVSDDQIDQVFEPLTKSSSSGLREVAEKLGAAVKELTAFYDKYADYISGEKQVTSDIYDEITKDTNDLENITKELDFSVDEKVIFDLTDDDLEALDDAANELYYSLRDEAND